jgi:hypothetical protein
MVVTLAAIEVVKKIKVSTVDGKQHQQIIMFQLE